MRTTRWRPICPDCGYSLRAACSDRCPECGAVYPTAGRAYRRWAMRRLPWDRRDRASLCFEYVKTVLWIIFCPWSAGQHIAMPDRWWRAARWAGAHILIATLAATLLCNGRLFSTWVWHAFVPAPFDHPLFFMSQAAPGGRMAVWLVQAFFAWLVLFASIPALGIALVLIIPRRRAWQQCAVKWSCYATVLLTLTVGTWYAWHWWFPPSYRLPGPLTIFVFGPAPDLPPSTAGTVFGAYWGLGLCGLVYRRRFRLAARLRDAWRSRPRTWLYDIIVRVLAAPCGLACRAAPYAALFAGAWWLLRHVGFPAGGLEALR